jgi:hypothetical protein
MWSFPLPFVTGTPADLGLQVNLDASTLTITNSTGAETWQDTRTTDAQNNYLYLNYNGYTPISPHAKPVLYGIGSENAYLGGVVGGFYGLFTQAATVPLTAKHDIRLRASVNLTSSVTNTDSFRLGVVQFEDGDTLEARIRTSTGPLLQLYAVYTDAANPGSPILTTYRTIPQGISTSIGFRTESSPTTIDIITEIDGDDTYTTTVSLPMKRITSVTPFIGSNATHAHDVNIKIYHLEFETLWLPS